MIKNEVVFITGGVGFIGCSIARRLLENNNEVIVYDNFTRDSLQYFPGLREHENLKIIQGDIRNKEAISSAIGNSTIIYHLAAIAGVSKYFSIPVDVLEVNILGTYNLLDAVKNNKNIKLFFDFSTSEIYGSNCFNAFEDGDVRLEDLNEKRWTYATSKIASEKFGMSYFWQYDVPFIGIRPFNIYGPGQVGEGVISYFLNNAIDHKTINITGDGSQSRTYCYIDDFISGLELLTKKSDDAIGKSFNIGTNTEIISVKSLAELAINITDSKSEIKYVKHLGEDVMVRSPNINRIKKYGYEPKYSLTEGLKNTAAWYSKNKVILD